jgi:hypothetical protein
MMDKNKNKNKNKNKKQKQKINQLIFIIKKKIDSKNDTQ